MKYFFFFAIFFSIILMILISKKWKKQGEKMGCFIYGFIFLVIFSLSTLFFYFSGLLLITLYENSTKPSYEAVITDYKAYTDRCEDSEGRSYNCTKHITYVEFSLENGEKIKLQTDLDSSKVPMIGEKMTVLYKQGDKQVNEVSWRVFLMFIGLFIMLFFMGAILLACVNYALGKSNERIMDISMKFLLWFVVPAGLIGFLFVFSSIIWEHYNNIEDYPSWVIAIAFFFSIILIPAILGYIKNIISGKPVKRRSKYKTKTRRRN